MRGPVSGMNPFLIQERVYTWGRVLSCTRRKPGSTAPGWHLTEALRIASESLAAGKVSPLTMNWRSMMYNHPRISLSDHRWPTANWSCWYYRQHNFYHAGCFMPVRGSQRDPALMCEENKAPMVGLPVLVFSGKCHWSCLVHPLEQKNVYRSYKTKESVRKDKKNHLAFVSPLHPVMQCWFNLYQFRWIWFTNTCFWYSLSFNRIGVMIIKCSLIFEQFV